MARSGITRDDILLTTLANGLKTAILKVKGPVECCGLAIMAGSRDELEGAYGLAHFVEHTIFKGTTHRRAHHILNRMETVGGELNAYTTKEETFVYTSTPAGNLARSIELLADLVVNSIFPANELDKEREVVADEISSYLDSPADAVYDDFEDKIYHGSQLGHNILGDKKSLRKMGSAECRHWVEDCYHADRMAFFYTGPAATSTVIKLAERYLNAIPSSGKPTERLRPGDVAPFTDHKSIRSHQAHTVMGCRLDLDDMHSRQMLTFFNNLVGGPGMNSLLNVALRERRGLVYTVDSSVSHYSDSTLWTTYFGCDDCHTGLCRQLVKDSVEQLALQNLTPRRLAAAKKQYLGQLTMARASVENVSLALGRCTLRDLPFHSMREFQAIIDSISPDDLRSIASLVASTPLCSLTFD